MKHRIAEVLPREVDLCAGDRGDLDPGRVAADFPGKSKVCYLPNVLIDYKGKNETNPCQLFLVFS